MIRVKRLLKHQAIATFSRIVAPRLKCRVRVADDFRPKTINVVSYFSKHNGISHGAALQGAAFKALGFNVRLVDVSRAMNNPFSKAERERADLFVVHCAGPDFVRLLWPLRHVQRRSKIVAYFNWEFADPPRWPKWTSLWDEIWAPSTFAAEALTGFCSSPVKVVPHVVLDHGAAPRPWAKGMDRLVFLTMADTRSSLARKNPIGAMKAFVRAFPSEMDVELVVKLSGAAHTLQFAEIIREIKMDSRMRAIHGTLSRDEVDRLFETAHIFVSLHRAEGFGLPLLEAQSHGLATIATGWSGNLDFTTPETTMLVPYTLATMKDDGGVYGGEVTWAEPDIDAAAQAMRRFYEDPAELARFARAGWLAASPDIQMRRFRRALQLAGTGD
jgi:glycosyltransferase involved in cell wall biosynthesis